nr:cupin domain-containing protein [Paenibacillus sp. MSJ-34]
MDYASPNAQFTYDLRNNPFFRKDDRNYINALSIRQLNTLGNTSLLDIYLSAGNVIEPHYHQNASELVYCISGAAVVSILNPFTKELRNYPIGPSQVANVPQGWWHYEVATADNTHLLAIFDAPIPEFIGGSDLLRLTPANVLAHTYCLDERKVRDTLAPITKTVFIGPPSECSVQQAQGVPVQQAYPQQAYSQQSYMQQAYSQQAYPQQAYCNQPQGYRYRQPTGSSRQPAVGNGG